MTLKKCDRCGKLFGERGGMYMQMIGERTIEFSDRKGMPRGGCDFQYDLCESCATVIAKAVELYDGKEENEK